MAAENHIEMLELSEGGVVVIDEHDNELDYMLVMAGTFPRKRWPKVLSRPGEHQTRLLNAILPESYMRPHMHPNYHQQETVQAIRGLFDVLIFDEVGGVSRSIQVSGRKIVSIPPGTWHTFVSETPYIKYVTIGNPEEDYRENEHKVFPDWAPGELTPEGEKYLEELKARISR